MVAIWFLQNLTERKRKKTSRGKIKDSERGRTRGKVGKERTKKVAGVLRIDAKPQ